MTRAWKKKRRKRRKQQTLKGKSEASRFKTCTSNIDFKHPYFWLFLLLALTLYLVSRPIVSHAMIWNQDPYAHLYYSNSIIQTSYLDTDDPFITSLGLDTFPAFHVLVASSKLLTNLSDWNVYRVFDVVLITLSVFIVYIFTTKFFNRRVGIWAGFLSATSFFFLYQIYDIGLTYNVLLMILSLLLFYFIIDLDNKKVPALLLVSLTMAFTHGYSITYILVLSIFLIVYLRKRDLKLTLLLLVSFLIILIHPAEFIYSTAFTATSRLDVTAARCPLTYFLDYVKKIEVTDCLNVIMQVFFMIFGLVFSYYKWFYKKERRFSLLFIWILALLVTWFVISYPFMVAKGEMFNLYECDRFLYYLTFPASICGAVLINFFEKRKDKLKYAVLLFVIIFSLYPSIHFSKRISEFKYPVEESYNAITMLKEVSSLEDIIITNEGQWIKYFIGCTVRQLSIQLSGGRYSWQILRAPPEIISRYIPTDDALFEGIKFIYKNRKPRYIFISYNDVVLYPHIVQWFFNHSNPEDRFEIAYYDDKSAIIRIVYFDKDYAIQESMKLISGEDRRNIIFADAFSIDVSPKYIGKESWLVMLKFEDGDVKYLVNKETGEVKKIKPK